MRKLPVLLFVALLALPAHAGLGSLFKAAGSIADDAARTGAKAGAHVDDAARHTDDAALALDSAAHGDDGARFGKHADEGDSLAGDAAQEALGIAVDIASDDAPEKTSPSPVDRETFKHARRLATLDALDTIARQSNDVALLTQTARIREKERVRHIAALLKMSNNTRAPGTPRTP